MSSIIYYLGDVRDRLAEIPDDSVDLLVTSPPFLALRDYLPANHPDKHREMGSESSPATFIDVLLALTAEWKRVLAPYGSICVELGDTYSGSGGAGGDYNAGGLRDGQPTFSARRNGATGAGWPLNKSMVLVPELYRIGLAYGINPLTGAPSPAGRWRVRNTVTWCKPNPVVGELGDKFRPATSDMVVACVGGKRYYDGDAVRQPAAANTHPRTARGVASRPNDTKSSHDHRTGGNRSTLAITHTDATAPPRDWWVISTAPFKGSHYATFPPELIRRPILAMSPERVCRTCGKPSERIAKTANAVGVATHRTAHRESPLGAGDGRLDVMDVNDAPDYAERVTLGWTDCGHDDWRPGLVLDPFGGTGTTGAVAAFFDRDAILIDLDDENLDLTRRRLNDRIQFDKTASLYVDEEVELDAGVVRFDVSVRGRDEVAQIRAGQLGLFG